MSEFQGKVAWFNNAKGYGFLTHPNAKDVFCHYTAVQKDGYKSLSEGDPVKFDIVQGDHGLQAADVVPLGPSTPTDKATSDRK